MNRALHIVSERKFLPWIRHLFTRDDWNSLYIVLQYHKKQTANKVLEDEMEISSDAFGIDHILTILRERDVVFYYFLDFPKTQVILKAAPHISHYWYFFGAEIYQQTNYFRKDLYGPATKKLLSALPEIQFRYHLRRFYYQWILRKSAPVQNLQKAIPHISNILWYVDDEIEMIRSRMELPPWLFLQFFTYANIIPDEHARTDVRSKKILLGNSATVENNHFDALQVVKRQKRSDYVISLPLTYGQFRRYKSRLKQSFQTALGENVFFLEGHLKLEEYYSFLHQHPTAIFLHYRQQGLGNIFYLLHTGTKVYLSGRNIIYHWLKKNDILVFNFEESFEKDYLADNLTMDEKKMEHNYHAIKKLLDHNRNEKTMEIIARDIRSKKTKFAL